MTDDNRVLHAKTGQKRMRIRGQLLEAILVMLGLRGLAEPDLVGRDNPVTSRGERTDCFFPGCRAEILAMK
jgi:hypothetical protein